MMKKEDRMNKPAETAADEKSAHIIAGRNAVFEAVKAGRAVDCLYVARGNRNGSIVPILAKAREKGIAIKEADEKKLSFLCGGANHQGVVASVAVKDYAEVEDIFRLAEERGEPPFIVLCDELEDPHNLGAVLRTCECAGAHGVIIPKRRSVGLTYAVGKASAGAVEYVPVARVSNMVETIKELKKRGVWVYGADMDGEPWCQVDFNGPCAIVVGSEGRGIGRLVRENCDFVVSLPMKGKINSLNASVACSIVCYEAARQRAGLKAKN